MAQGTGGAHLDAISRCFGCGPALAATIAAKAALHDSAAMLTIHPRAGGESDSCVLTAGAASEVAFGRGGQSLLLHRIGVGDLFGAVLGDETSGGTEVIALGAAQSAHFAPNTIVQLIECYPVVALGVTRQLSRRLSETRRRVVDRVMLSAVGRICLELRQLAEAAPDAVIRPMPVWSELALQLNSTRETVSRTVSRLEARGIIERVGDGLRVVAPHRLDEMIV